jgi:hypothetical protein
MEFFSNINSHGKYVATHSQAHPNPQAYVLLFEESTL